MDERGTVLAQASVQCQTEWYALAQHLAEHLAQANDISKRYLLVLAGHFVKVVVAEIAHVVWPSGSRVIRRLSCRRCGYVIRCDTNRKSSINSCRI